MNADAVTGFLVAGSHRDQYYERSRLPKGPYVLSRQGPSIDESFWVAQPLVAPRDRSFLILTFLRRRGALSRASSITRERHHLEYTRTMHI